MTNIAKKRSSSAVNLFLVFIFSHNRSAIFFSLILFFLISFSLKTWIIAFFHSSRSHFLLMFFISMAIPVFLFLHLSFFSVVFFSHIFSRVLRDSTPHFVCPSVRRSVGHILLFLFVLILSSYFKSIQSF